MILKKIYFFFIANLFLGINFVFAGAQNDTKNAILGGNTLGLSGGDDDKGTVGLNQVFERATNLVFTLLWVAGVGVFLYFGYRLLMARGNQEEMKKVLMGFVYAIIGLAIIPLAYVLVTLVSSLNI